MDAFHMLLSWGVKIIADLIPIHLHLNKISKRHHLQVVFLPQQYALNFLLDKHHSKKAKPHHLSIAYITCKQQSKIKSSVVNTNNCLNEEFSFFDRLHKELSLGFHLVDMFSNHFSFHTVNCKDTNAKTAYCNKLNKIYKKSLLNPNTVLIIGS